MRWFVLTTMAMAMAMAMGCGVSESGGAEVTLGITHHFTPREDGTYPEHASDTPRIFTTAENVAITLTRGYLALESVELLECHSAALWRRVRQSLTLVSLAHAHSETTGTRLGQPWVESLLHEDLAVRELGHLEPPLGSYCQLRVTLGPADGHATHLPTEVGMVGKSLYLEGTYDDGSGPQGFIASANGVRTLTLDLEETLALTEDSQDTTLVLGMRYDTWLNAVTFPNPNGAAVLANAGVSLHPHGAAHHDNAAHHH